MLVSEKEKLCAEIAALAEQHGRDRSALIPILQDLQDREGWISDFAMQEIARLLDIHPVEVYSVISFYAFLNAEKKGHFIFRLCRTISCDMAGKDRIARQLENELGIKFGETTEDGHFSLEYTNCMGWCDQGPALMVNDQVFTKVTAQKVHDIVEACRRVWALYPTLGDAKTIELPGAMRIGGCNDGGEA